jgi:hypothetical protein
VPEEVPEMSSRIKNTVEPILGWLFVIAIILAVGGALLAATRPTVEMTGRIPVHQTH